MSGNGLSEPPLDRPPGDTQARTIEIESPSGPVSAITLKFRASRGRVVGLQLAGIDQPVEVHQFAPQSPTYRLSWPQADPASNARLRVEFVGEPPALLEYHWFGQVGDVRIPELAKTRVELLAERFRLSLIHI